MKPSTIFAQSTRIQGTEHSPYHSILVLRSEEHTHWFIHNLTKSGQSKYLELHTNDDTRPIRGRLRLEHPSIDGLLSLPLIPMTEYTFLV